MVKKKANVCAHGGRSCAAWMLILGLLILGNALWATVSWPVFIGAIVALVGLKQIIWPCDCF